MNHYANFNQLMIIPLKGLFFILSFILLLLDSNILFIYLLLCIYF
jgi:hypothetical protein